MVERLVAQTPKAGENCRQDHCRVECRFDRDPRAEGSLEEQRSFRHTVVGGVRLGDERLCGGRLLVGWPVRPSRGFPRRDRWVGNGDRFERRFSGTRRDGRLGRRGAAGGRRVVSIPHAAISLIDAGAGPAEDARWAEKRRNREYTMCSRSRTVAIGPDSLIPCRMTGADQVSTRPGRMVEVWVAACVAAGVGVVVTAKAVAPSGASAIENGPNPLAKRNNAKTAAIATVATSGRPEKSRCRGAKGWMMPTCRVVPGPAGSSASVNNRRRRAATNAGFGSTSQSKRNSDAIAAVSSVEPGAWPSITRSQASFNRSAR